MANEEQLSILKQGVEVWNKWRYSSLRSRAYLTGADPRGYLVTREYININKLPSLASKILIEIC